MSGPSEKFRPPAAHRPAGDMTGGMTGGMGLVDETAPQIVKFTVIAFDEQAGTYVFTPSVRATQPLNHRPLPREDAPGAVDRAYVRVECEFDRGELKDRGLGEDSHLVWAVFPGGYQSVFTARLQKPGAKNDPDLFPPINREMTGRGSAHQNPLGFSEKDNEDRKNWSDLETVEVISSAERDIYLNKNIMRASFAAHKTSACFFHDPDRTIARWAGFRAAPGAARADRWGFVNAPDLEAVIRHIEDELAPYARMWRRWSANGVPYVINDRMVVLSPRIEDSISDFTRLAVMQALAGLKGPEDPLMGQPVVHLATRYFRRRMIALNDRFADEWKKIQRQRDESPDLKELQLDPERQLILREDAIEKLTEIERALADDPNDKDLLNRKRSLEEALACLSGDP